MLFMAYTAHSQTNETVRDTLVQEALAARQDTTVRTSLLKEILDSAPEGAVVTPDSLAMMADTLMVVTSMEIDAAPEADTVSSMTLDILPEIIAPEPGQGTADHEMVQGTVAATIISGDKVVDIVPAEGTDADVPAQPEVITALDYVAALNDAVEFFKIRRGELSRIYSEWALAADGELAKLALSAKNAAQLEGEVNSRTYSTYRLYTPEIAGLMSELEAERAKARAIVGAIKDGKAGTELQLREIEKLEAKLQADMFKKVAKNMSPSAQAPAETRKSVDIYFSARPQLDELAGYTSALNEMLMWYWCAERSLTDVVLQWNEKVTECVEMDKRYKAQLDELQPYAADKNAKKSIAQINKDRKALAKSMSGDSKELAKQVKAFENELKAAYKERLNHVIAEMNYIVNDRTGY